MQKIMLCRGFVTFLCLGLGLQAAGAVRAWTDDAGRRLEAEFAGVQGDSVRLRLTSGETVTFPMARLSVADRSFVESQAGAVPTMVTATPAGDAAATTPAMVPEAVRRVPVEQRVWPQNVVVPSRAVEIAAVSESVAERRFVYQSEAFEFTSQAKLAGSVMKEVARTFESTRALVEALPWGIVCRPPEGRPRFKAALFETRQDYLEAGGPENSGGVYSTGDKVFKIPFPSLGLEKRGQTYYRDDAYSNGTLVHEITHQLMDEYLNFLPTWVIEGTAEYAEMLPYNAGTFRAAAHKSALKEDVAIWQEREGFAPDIGSLETHLKMTREAWLAACNTPQRMREMYHRSQLLVYFFCHLDGDKKGTRFIRYLEAVHGEVLATRAFFADPRVKRMEGGRFSYPRSMTPPDMSPEAAFKHLPILLEERSFAKIAAEMTAAFKDIAVKIRVE